MSQGAAKRARVPGTLTQSASEEGEGVSGETDEMLPKGCQLSLAGKIYIFHVQKYTHIFFKS